MAARSRAWVTRPSLRTGADETFPGKMPDNVPSVPMFQFRNSLVHLLNIRAVGPQNENFALSSITRFPSPTLPFWSPVPLMYPKLAEVKLVLGLLKCGVLVTLK